MGDWTLRKGDRISLEWDGQVYPLIVEDIALAGATEIRWQQGGRPPLLKSVTLRLRDQTPDEREDGAALAPGQPSALAEPEISEMNAGRQDVIDAVSGAIAELDLGNPG